MSPSHGGTLIFLALVALRFLLLHFLLLRLSLCGRLVLGVRAWPLAWAANLEAC
jgi:hypothetical protein